MKLDYLYLIFVGYVVHLSEESGGHGKHVHVRIHVPILIEKHKHTHTVYKKPHKVEPKKHIVIHKHIHQHGHKHGHNHGHKHDHKAKHDHKHKHNHKHGHKHDHKHKHKHHGHKHHHHGHDYGHHDYKPHHYDHHDYVNKNNEFELLQREPDIHPADIIKDDDYKTSKKLLKTEHVEVQHIDHYASDPSERVKIAGSYKVQESDPYDSTTTSYHTYDSPITKEIAKQLTNFKNEQEQREDEESEAIKSYENYDDDSENFENYVIQPEEGDGGRYHYGKEKSEHYVSKDSYK